ncbi:MAG: hypothetical protein PHT33_11195, partial [bacterium]|nr:hypothetical protein [bacterium]
MMLESWMHAMPVYFMLYFLLPAFVFSSAVLASMVTERGLPALVCTPLTAGVQLLAMLPLIVQFYSCSYAFMLSLSVITAVLPLCLILIIRHCRQSGSRRSPGEVLAVSILVVMLVSHGIHAALAHQSGRSLSAALIEAEESGLVSSPGAVVKPLNPGEANAADYYKEAFKLNSELGKGSEHAYYSNSRTFPGGLTLQQRASGIKAMTGDPQHDRLYKLISRAAALVNCRFGREYTRDILSPNSYYGKVREISRFMIMRTYFLAEAGRYDEAWDNARTGLFVSNCLQDNPMLYTGIARITGDKAALRSFHIVVEGNYGDTTADYEDLDRELELKKRQSLSALKLSMNGEMLRIMSELGRLHAMVLPGYTTYLMSPAFNRDKAQAVGIITRLAELTEVP